MPVRVHGGCTAPLRRRHDSACDVETDRPLARHCSRRRIDRRHGGGVEDGPSDRREAPKIPGGEGLIGPQGRERVHGDPVGGSSYALGRAGSMPVEVWGSKVGTGSAIRGAERRRLGSPPARERRIIGHGERNHAGRTARRARPRWRHRSPGHADPPPNARSRRRGAGGGAGGHGASDCPSARPAARVPGDAATLGRLPDNQLDCHGRRGPLASGARPGLTPRDARGITGGAHVRANRSWMGSGQHHDPTEPGAGGRGFCHVTSR